MNYPYYPYNPFPYYVSPGWSYVTSPVYMKETCEKCSREFLYAAADGMIVPKKCNECKEAE